MPKSRYLDHHPRKHRDSLKEVCFQIFVRPVVIRKMLPKEKVKVIYHTRPSHKQENLQSLKHVNKKKVRVYMYLTNGKRHGVHY